jgi:hypothetical protein
MTDLTGPLPAWLGKLHKLRQLTIIDAGLSGEVKST